MTNRLKLCHTSWPCFLPLLLQSVLRNFSFLTFVLCACIRRVSNFNYLVLLKPLLRFLRCSLRNLSKIINYLRCLQTYQEKTRVFRPILAPSQPNQLLLSYRRPNAPVKSCTIARWIKSVLGKAGIDTSIFKAHSTRSASTSRALSSGVPLEEVLKMADWSGPSTFNRFSYRPSFGNSFVRSVLESAK